MEDQAMPSTVQPLNNDDSPMDGVTSDAKLKEEPDPVKLNGEVHAHIEEIMGQEAPVSPTGSTEGFQCKLCTFIAHTAAMLEEHNNVHLGRKPFKCVQCGFTCAYQNMLLQHIQMHHDNDQKAEGGESPSEEDMDDHSMNGNEAMMAQENMQNMLEVDQEAAARGDRQPSVYQCKLCTYIAPTKTHLNEHMNVHSGNKPYKCLVCGFSSSFRSSLMRHLIVHTGTAKMFKCDRCLYQTPYKCNLVTHRKKKHPDAMYGIDFGAFLTQDEINRENNTGKLTSPSKNMDINSLYTTSHTTVFPGSVMTNSVGINRMGNVSPIIDVKYSTGGPGAHSIDPASLLHVSQSVYNHSGHMSQAMSQSNSGAVPNSNSYTQNLPMADDSSRTSPSSADGYTSVVGTASHNESTSRNTNSTGRNEQAVAIDFSNTAQFSAEESDNSGPVVSDIQSLTSSPGGITSPIMSPTDNIPPHNASATSPSTMNEISVITPLQLQQQKSYEDMLEKPFGAKKRKRKPTALPVPFSKRYTMEINREREAALARKAYEEGLTGRSDGDIQYLPSRPLKSRILSGNAFITSTSGNLDHLENPSNTTASDTTNTSSVSQVKTSDFHPISEETLYHFRGHHDSGKGSVSSNHFRRRSVETQTMPMENDSSSIDPTTKAHIQTCPYCGTMFPEQVIYSLHMSCHGNEHPFQCSICQYVCRDKIEFTCHITRSQHTR